MATVFAVELAAEPGSFPPPQNIDASSFEHLTNLDGLSQVSISAIAQDTQGFMWIGTSEGLNRYDGYEFRVFNHEPGSTHSLSHRRVQSLYAGDPEGLWVGTDGGGLNFLDTVTGHMIHSHHNPEDPYSLRGETVFAITRDRSGFLWVGTDSGLSRLESPQLPWRFTRFSHGPEEKLSAGPPLANYVTSPLAGEKVEALLVDRQDQLWIGTESGLDRFAPDRQARSHFHHDPQDPHSLANDQVHALLEDSSGTLWIGTDRGLDRFTADGEGFAHYLPEPEDPSAPSNEIRALGTSDRGAFWIATRGGLFLFDRASGHFTAIPFETDDSPAKSAVSALWVDAADTLWFGTWVAGIYRYDPHSPRFTHVYHDPKNPDSLFYDTVYAFAEDQDHDLWVGTAGGGVNHFNATTGTFTHFRHDPQNPNSLGSHSIRCLEFDRRGSLWIATRDHGLDRFDPKRQQFTHYRHDPEDPASLRDDQVLRLTEDRSGTLWVGTRKGLDRYEPTSDSFEHYDLLPADPTAQQELLVMAILEDRAGNLWVGTDSGLFRYDNLKDSTRADPQRKGRYPSTHYSHDPAQPNSLSYNYVLSLLEDTEGILWVGTGGGGLNRLDPASGDFTRFTADDGLGNNIVHAMLQDRLGRLWVSTNQGLARFDPPNDRWAHYDRADGLQDTEFNVGAALHGHDGTMYFGGIHGYNAFHPEHFLDNPYIPPVVLTSFGVLQRGSRLVHPIKAGKIVSLNYHENFFSFEFAALNYTRPDKNRYSFRLMGFDDDWVDAGTRRFANYTNVPPGEYTFRVRGSNNDDVWNEQGASLQLRITPPWWRSWWARSLFVLAMAASLGGIAWTQRSKLQRERLIAERERATSADLEVKNAELERFVYTVSHDLKNPLVTIRNYVGHIQHDLTAMGQDGRVLADLERIDQASARMHQMLEELVELSRIGRIIHPPQIVPFGQLVQEAAELLAASLHKANVELVIADSLPEVCVDHLRVREVLQNLLENAVKFLGDQSEPRIEVGMRSPAVASAVFFVRDNGIGIEPRYQERAFQLFERLNPTLDGTGIGLALVKRIIEAHEGRIWIESEGLGKGTTFCFTLPLAQGSTLPRLGSS